MPLFGSTEPGADIFNKCPKCGADEIYSQSEGLLKGTKYLCDDCGYQAQKSEVRTNQGEIHEKNQKKVNNKFQEWGVPEEALPETDKSLDDISDQELTQQVKDRIAEGWEIEEVTDSGERVVMTATEGGTIGGHALTGVLTGLTTFGLGNVAYGELSKKKNRERIVLRAEDDSPVAKNRDTENLTELIRELKQLNEDGLITDTEFEEKKQQLLNEI
ncbi:hypothetical protein PNP85_13595 [Halobacterium salinarum]|uniref:hypothetical protein n=1 Tax=Halobacterium salinarum TaxID=2242 RepID=UPI0025579DD7|nr:hypothetical protein [Halobacterium salinarum]MDL0136047.1 hypothetical protein [Halobacterium salinarum]MDL0140537.1 hypothetical protein [Halobacterium salinarum]